MKLKTFFAQELSGFNLFEKIFFPLEIIFIIVVSFILNDSKIALISALAGISYTILAGKGKISCYFIGLLGTFCYCYISYKNGFYGNLSLYLFYFFPMQIIGIFKWFKHINKNTGSIYKTKLSKKELYCYFLITILLTLITGYILNIYNDSSPYLDSITTIFSILGQILTVKRCIEQWYVWFIVDFITLIMWIKAYFNNSNCLATTIMWATYCFLAIYFFKKWNDELSISNAENI